MISAINVIVEVGMFVALLAMLYVIVQVVDVIREEKERLMWYREIKALREDHERDNGTL